MEEMWEFDYCIIIIKKQMQFLQFGDDSQDQTQLHHHLYQIHLKLKPFRFINDLNQKSSVCYPQIDDEAMPLKIIGQPQFKSFDQKAMLAEHSLGKAKSYYENELKKKPSQNLDPEEQQPPTKPKLRKRITIEKKLSDNATLSGPGVIKLKDGKVIFGTWKEGQTVGLVKIMYPSGNLYIGEAKNYLHHGRGRFCYKNGYKYEGDFVNGKFSGYGVMTNDYGEIVSKGVWSNGTLVQSII